jgi:hypothetical protein
VAFAGRRHIVDAGFKVITMIRSIFAIQVAVTLVAFCSFSSPGLASVPIRHPQLDSDAQSRLNRAERAADAYVEDWQASLDFAMLYEKIYTRRDDVRKRNALLFPLLYRCTAGLGFTPKVQSDVDQRLIEQAFVSMENASLLSSEFALATMTDADEQKEPADIRKLQAALRRTKSESLLEKKGLGRSDIEDFIVRADALSQALRVHLKAGAFTSEQYLSNVREFESEQDPSTIEHGARDFGIGPEIDVYIVRRGVFEFCLIEEGDDFRVVTLQFEC